MMKRAVGLLERPKFAGAVTLEMLLPERSERNRMNLVSKTRGIESEPWRHASCAAILLAYSVWLRYANKIVCCVM